VKRLGGERLGRELIGCAKKGSMWPAKLILYRLGEA
jgi:hypothetical protein